MESVQNTVLFIGRSSCSVINLCNLTDTTVAVSSIPGIVTAFKGATRDLAIQYRSNVSYHFSSRFSRDASRFSRDESRFSRDESCFSRDASRFARESLKHLVWNIFYMYYSQEASVHIKDGATILTCKHQQKVRSNVHCEILCVSIDCSIHVEQTY